ncbi:hypothetical protein SEA_REYNAULD_98 [Rhodococcus phage Reynauld]|uniref:Uncharacterized protein n=1 Tax=Rhodococcus phage Reynauld TaxID=3062845 RepID=A0ACD4UHJ7_9CAUD|nr:hypothetical protein SEA_REYNAULD_98 [Rhodococcus phage Reynauld]
MADNNFQRYTVRLHHDNGVANVTTRVVHPTPDAALAAVLGTERAPRSAVMAVTAGTERDMFATVLGTNSAARDAMSKRRSFTNKGRSFYAVETLAAPGHTDELPAEARAALHAQFDEHVRVFGRRTVYVVWSYNTPIAWTDTDGALVVPDIRYSMTTTRHQTECRMADGARSVSLGMADAPSWRGRSGRR